MTPSASTDTPLESIALATTSMLRVTLMTVTSLEGHVKYFLDDSLPGAFACMQGRRPGYGGPREQPSPPPGSLLGQGPNSYYRQVHGEGVQVTKVHLPSGGWCKWDPGKDFYKQNFVGHLSCTFVGHLSCTWRVFPTLSLSVYAV